MVSECFFRACDLNLASIMELDGHPYGSDAPASKMICHGFCYRWFFGDAENLLSHSVCISSIDCGFFFGMVEFYVRVVGM